MEPILWLSLLFRPSREATCTYGSPKSKGVSSNGNGSMVVGEGECGKIVFVSARSFRFPWTTVHAVQNGKHEIHEKHGKNDLKE
jgi:hypothetical protein